MLLTRALTLDAHSLPVDRGEFMKTIGNERFAVEFDLEPRTGDPEADSWLFGHMRFVVGGRAIGNDEDLVSLRAASAALSELVANRGRRDRSALMRRSAEAIFKIAYEALYVDNGQTDEQLAMDWDDYSPLLGVAKGFEAFDGWQAFLVEDELVGRYVWRDMRAPTMSQVEEQILKRGEMDDVLEAFLAEMKSLPQAR
jgi:hypothetical protein